MDSRPQDGPARLRALLDRPGLLLLPGVADALTARLARDAGFEALYATGAGIANALLGLPDVGLTTMSEIVEQVARIARAVDLPVVADADTGYGNPLNVMRTVQEFERAGAAASSWRTRSAPSAAAISRARRSSRRGRWCRSCARRSPPAATPTSS